MAYMSYAEFAAIVEEIESGKGHYFEGDTVYHFLDVARKTRTQLPPQTAATVNTAISHRAPDGYTMAVEFNGSRNRVVLRKVGKTSSLDDSE